MGVEKSLRGTTRRSRDSGGLLMGRGIAGFLLICIASLSRRSVVDRELESLYCFDW